jgi:hypothetical protein
MATIALVSLVTLLMMTLVIVLSIRLRRAEIVTMWKMGCSRCKIASIRGGQIAITLAASFAIATLLTVGTNAYGPELVRFLFL